MVSIYSPATEEENISVDNHLYGAIDPNHNFSKVLGMDTTFNPLEEFKATKHQDVMKHGHLTGHSSSCMIGHTAQEGSFNYGFHFTGSALSKPYEIDREYADKSCNGLKSISIPNIYDFDFPEHNVFEHPHYSTSDINIAATGRPPLKKYSSSIDSFHQDTTVVSQILVGKGADVPPIMTPITPDHPKSSKEYKSLMAMGRRLKRNKYANATFGNLEVSDNVATVPAFVNPVKQLKPPKNRVHKNIITESSHSTSSIGPRTRYNSAPDLRGRIDFDEFSTTSPLNLHDFDFGPENQEYQDQHGCHDYHDHGHSHEHSQDSFHADFGDDSDKNCHFHSHSHVCGQDCEHDTSNGGTEIDTASISYEELRNAIVERFSDNGNHDKRDSKENDDEFHLHDYNETEATEVSHNPCRNPDGSWKSVLQQLLDDKPLMEAIKNKQKRGAYKCAHCPKTFNTIFEFAKHIDEYQIERKYKCPFPLCPWKILGLPKLSELRRHCMNQHFDELTDEQKFIINGGKSKAVSKVYHCESPYCDKKFHRRDSYNRHVKMVHENPNSRFNIRLQRALKSCPETLKSDPEARDRYVREMMKQKHRRR